ncbi:MAG: CARDB domain-containing protein [Caldilineaceae bacterium]
MTVVLLLALVIQTLPLPQWSGALAQGDDQAPAYVPGQLIIGFRPGVTQEQIADFYATYGLAEKEDLDSNPEDTDQGQKLASVQVDVTPDLIQLLESDPRVRYAEPNYLLHIARTPDDPDFDKLWGLRNVGQTGGLNGADVSAMEAWDVSTGSKDIVIAIIDTGIDYNHEDLAANIWVNKKECPQGYGKCQADGKDDDNNGYVDDFYGANTINDTGEIMDDFGHGTHVAGTIGGVGNNGTGVVGVNWNIQILGCKFLSASGSGTTSNAIKCFNYVDELKNKQGYNIVLTSNSWGGGLYSEALLEAMGGPNAPLHVCAAGNANSSRISYPAGYELDNIISVAATDHEDLYASFSNWGADWVDLAAPGVDIYSTVPQGSCAMCDSSGYRSASGTSMATPHVSGAAALVWAKYPNLTAEQVKDRLLSGADPLNDQSKQTLTNARLNLLNAMEDDQTAPAPITNLAVSGVLMTQVNLTWTATGDDGLQGSANAYDIRYATSPISDATWKDAHQVENEPAPQPAGSIERFTVTDLQPATTYYFAMKAMDNVGNESDLSNIVVVATSAGTIVFEDNMENGAGDWDSGDADSLWHLSQLRSNSPSNAWYYGKEDTHNYDTGKTNRGYLTSPAITLVDADEVMLTFYEWSQLQTNEDFDRTRVQVSTDGDIWQTVFESHGTEEGWVKRTVSLSPYIERSGVVHVRFYFDTVNDRFNNFEGWYIDDVQVLVAKLARPGEEQPMANLVVRSENVGFNPLHPQEGDQVVIHAVVLNNGQDEANDVAVYVADVTSGEPIPISQSQNIATIPAGGSGAVEVLYNTTGKVGERTIQVVADPGNFVPEVSNTDNSAEATLTVADRPAPNLAIEAGNIGFDPSPANPGDQVTVYAMIRNDGDADASDIQVQFVDATGTGTAPIGDVQTIDVIPAGGSATLQVTYDTAGLNSDRDIGVVIDPNNVIEETRESDNSAEKRLSLIAPAAPNLVMLKTNIGFDPISPTEGDTVTLRASVLNDGNTEARDVLVQFVDGTGNASTPIGEQQTIEVIPAGGSGIAEVTYDTASRAGDRKIKVVVDPHNFVAETKETDNSSEDTLKVALPPTANLSVQAGNIGISPISPVEGAVITIYATIVNNGDADAGETVVQFIDVTDGGALPIGDKQTIESIAAGGSDTVQVNYNTAHRAGERIIQVVVDPGNFIKETDETDNAVKKTVNILAPPLANLVILANNIEFTPPDPTDRARVNLHAVVLNNGADDAHHVLVQFIDMTTGVAIPIGGEQFIELIPVGGSGEVEATLNLTGEVKDRKIQVQVDSNNLIPESNERDNTATKTLPVSASPLPNLAVMAETFGFAPSQPKQGDVVTLTAVVLNNGAADAQNIAVQFADVTNGRPIPIGEQQIIDALPVGSSSMVSVHFDTSMLAALPATGLSERRIRVEVDPNNFIRELDEIDNKDTATLSIEPPPAPNLVVQASNIGFAPPSPRNGDQVSVTVTILNAGVLDAGQVLVQFVDVTDGAMTPVGAKQTIALIPAGGSATTGVSYDTTDKEGARKIQVLVDPHAMIQESSESDNSAIQTLTVMPAPAPNLVVQAANIGVNPINPSEGEVVTLRATVLNSGETDASDVVVQFVDVTEKSPVPIGANQTIALIPAGGSGVAEVTYDTTGKVNGSQSARKIQVIADRNNLIVESNENDNSATQTVSISPLPAPNLMVQVSNIGFDPVQPNPGDQVTVYATIINNGTSDATNVMVQLVDATNSSATSPIGQPQTIEAIPAGGSGVVQLVYDTTGKSGDRKILVVVDPNNFVQETNERDNNATKTLSLVPESAPNLVISSNNVIFTPSEPRDGELTIIRALVINDGNALANNVVVQFMDVTDSSNSFTIGQPQVIDTIAVGGSGTAQVSYNTAGLAAGAPDGARKIKVVVDPNNFIAESKETDNQVSSKTLTVDPPAGINLTMHSGNIGFNPAQPVEGDRIAIHAVVVNSGVNDANDITVQFVDVTAGGNTPIGAPQVIDSIPAGSSGTAQVLLDSEGSNGERRIQVTVDPNNFIPETNEGDNEAAAVLTISAPPAPNLMLLAGNVKFTPAEPAEGNPVTITVTLLNGGSADATDVVVQLLDVTGGGSRPIGPEQVIDELPAGGNTTLNVIYENTDQAGERQIQVTADPNDAIAESDEGDNRAVKTLTISPPKIPNLVVRGDGIQFSDAKPIVGDQVGITATVRNDGNVEVTNVLVHIVDATDGGIELIGDPQTIDRIAAGGSADVVVEYDTTDKAGDRRIRVTADPDDKIFETNELDNEATKTLRVASESEEPPDLPNLVLFSGNVRFEPSSPKAGDTVTATVTVLNEGTQPAEQVGVRLVDVTDGGSDLLGEGMITDTIVPGESGVFSVTFSTADKSGTRQIEITVDPDNTIPETNEDDNQVTKSLSIGAAVAEAQSREVAGAAVVGRSADESVNLTVQIEGVSVEALGENDSLLTVTALVENLGDAPAAGVLVQFVDGTAGAGGLGGLQRLAQVAPGANAEAQFSFVLPGAADNLDSRELAVTVDPYDTLAEADESDNVATLAVDVAALRARPLEVSVVP